MSVVLGTARNGDNLAREERTRMMRRKKEENLQMPLLKLEKLLWNSEQAALSAQ